MDDAQLNQLTVKELQVLKDQVDAAIRAAIRKKLSAKTPAPKKIEKIDLERERDAWLLAKR